MKRFYPVFGKLFLCIIFSTSFLALERASAQGLCIADTSYTDVIFLIDNSQSIDEQEFEQFEEIIVRTIQKVQLNCQESQIGLVHYGGAFGLETFVEFDLSTQNVFTSIERQFCTSRNSAGFCPEGGGDDLNNAIGDIITAIENGGINRIPDNDFQLVIFTDAFGFEPECTFINCSQILPFTNIDRLKQQFDANVTVVGASSQAEASLLAVYASPGGDFDNVGLNNCEGTFDGCETPRQYIPVEFDSPVEETSDIIAGFVECNITVMQVVNPELGANLSVCSDFNESVTLTVSLPDNENGVMYEWDNDLPSGPTVVVSPSVTTTYTVTVTDDNGCTGQDQITVFAESCLPDCSPDTSYADIIFLVDNSQSIDEQEFGLFENLMLTTINKVQAKCESSQLGLVHYGGAFGSNTTIEYDLSTANQFTSIERQFCTERNNAGFCTEGGGDDLNHAVGDLIDFLEDGTLNRNPINKLRLVIFTDAFGFEDTCTFVNCSQIRPFTNIDILKENFNASVTVVGASEQAESSLLALYASQGGNFDNVTLFQQDCASTFDGCALPRKYIPLEFDSPVGPSSDSIVACVDCDIEILEGVVASLGEDQTICSDLDSSATINATLLNGTGSLSYQWDNGIPNQGSVVVQPDVNTTYNITISDEIGCSDSTSVTVFVEVCFPCTSPPTIACPATYVTCPGTSIQPSVAGMPQVSKANEQCPDIVTSFRDDTISVQGCNMAIARTWTAGYVGFSDPGLEVTCVQNINVQDETPPEIFNIPDDITVNTDQSCSAVVNWSFPNALDDCDLQSISSNFPSGSTFLPGVTEVIYSAIDVCGNVAMASFNVTVIEACCTTPPTISCPADYVGCPGSSIDPSVTGFPTGMAGSDQCATPQFEFADQTISTINCNQVIMRTWTAFYGGNMDASLTATCQQMITLTDTEPPVISNVPDDIVLNSDLTCTAQVFWTAPTAEDNCQIQSFSSNVPIGSTFDAGVTNVIYSAIDACGNMTMVSFTVTVNEVCCTDPPVITCPANITICPGSSIDPSVTGFATAIPGGDNCPAPNVSFEDSESGSDVNCSRVITRTWTASYGGLIDGSLTARCIQTIRISDTENPIITNLPDNIVVDSDQSCTARVTWNEPVVMDNCGIESVVSNIPSGTIFDVGITSILYTATDNCGNTSSGTFTVTVNEVCCRIPPIITCPANFTGCPGDGIQPSITGSATAISGSENCPQPAVSFSDEVVNDTSDCSLVIRRTWTASYPGLTDPALRSSCIQFINLIDQQAPVITGLPSQIMLASDSLCVKIVNWDPPVAADNCGVADIGSDIAPGSVFNIGSTPVTYMASDFCGNTSMVSFEVVVTQACCMEDPSIIAPPDHFECVGTSTDPEVTGMATGIPGSAICQDPIVTYMDMIISEGPNGQIEILRTWKATDPVIDSLMATVTQTIILDDIIPPTIIDCPEDVTLDPDDPVHSWEDPIGVDNCGVILSVNIESGSTFPTGVTEVIYIAIDPVGLTDTCSFFVTVPEEVMLDCPEDFSVRCLKGLSPSDIPLPGINTNCAECRADNIDGFAYLGFSGGSSYYISDDVDDWQEARRTAMNAGGYLAIINDEEENEFLRSVLRVNSAWIGLQDYDLEGDFRWVDGSPLTYSNWFDGQPNNFGNRQDYVEIMPNGQWNDQSNNKSLHYIIEVECVNLTTTIDSMVIGDNVMSYTVTYSAVDRCGTDDECTFMITADNEPNLECPEDIVVEVPYGWSRVSWEEPVYNTCCEICPRKNIHGYIFMGNLGDSYYYCSAGKSSWRSAERRAESIGGTLAIIETEEENAYISSRLIQREAWIGLTDRDREGRFRWVNGTNPSYTSWRPGQPDGSGDYVEMNENGYWYDSDGSEKLEFVVEIKGCDHVDQIGGPQSGSNFRTGATTITYRASDGCGGVDTCSFDVIITTGIEEDDAAVVDAISRSGEKVQSDIIESWNIDLFPNPATDFINLDLNQANLPNLELVEVFQANGERILSFIPDKNIEAIDVSTFMSGLYLIRVSDNNGDSQVKKFTVR